MYIIVDGSSVAYRAFHSPPVSGFRDTPDFVEEMPGASKVFIQSFCRQLGSIVNHIELRRPKFTKLFICWDGARSLEGRRALYDPYKRAREKDRDTRAIITPHTFINLLRQQLSYASPRLALHDVCAEADDLIGIMCELLDADQKCVVTGDKDMFQLVNDRTAVLDPGKYKWNDVEAVKEDFGVTPDMIVEYKAIIGDSSDNYPGIRGYGPKKGIALIESNANYDVTNPEVETFRKIAKIPFAGLDEREFLSKLMSVDFDEPINWEHLTKRWDFDVRAGQALQRIT